MKEETVRCSPTAAMVVAVVSVFTSLLTLGWPISDGLADGQGPEAVAAKSWGPIVVRRAASDCAVAADVSGSGVDNPDNWGWLLSSLEEVGAGQWSLDPEAKVGVILFAEAASTLGAYRPEERDRLVADVVAAARPSQWGDPVPALQAAARLPRVNCLVIVTDGSLNLPPTVGPAEFATSLAMALEELAARRVPVLVVALHDDAGDLWRAVAGQTGGAYLVDPDSASLRKEMLDMLLRLSPTTAPQSPSPTPRATETVGSPTTASAVAPTAPSDQKAPGSPLWLLPGVIVSASIVTMAAVTTLVALRRSRPRLSGTLEIHQTKEEEHVS